MTDVQPHMIGKVSRSITRPMSSYSKGRADNKRAGLILMERSFLAESVICLPPVSEVWLVS
jgi:hypothetical protein